ncbi:MAG: hypothetical protein R3A46_20670 [Thermomicrobiales bacterium]
MGRRIAVAAGGLVLGILGLLVAFLLSMRFKFQPVQRLVRRVNRAFWNPMAMKTAGEPDAAASIVRHVGRTSGNLYETPVGAVETEEGFIISLPYGTSPDWLKNVRAAGEAVVVHGGTAWKVDSPEIVSSDVGNAYFAPSDQRVHRIFGVDDFLTLRRVGEDAATRPD